MAEEGSKPVYTETEVDAAIAAEAVARDAAIAVEAAARAAAIVAHAANYGLHTKLIVKSADETLNNDDTLQDDDELKFAVAANEVWAFIMLPIVNTSTSADFKFTFTIPAGGSIYGLTAWMDSSNTTRVLPFTVAIPFDVGGGGANYISMMLSGVVVNGATAGNVQLQWAQNTAEESDTKVLKNSCILAWKLA